MPPISAALHNADQLARGLALHGIRCTTDAPAVLIVGVTSDADLDMFAALATAHPRIPALVLVPRDSSNESALRALAAAEQGAAALLPFDRDVEHVATTLEQLLDGQLVADAFIGALLLRGLRARAEARAQFAITERERDVLALVVEGHTGPTIAKALGIGLGTVQTHLKSLYRKLDVSSRAAATAIALRHHLL